LNFSRVARLLYALNMAWIRENRAMRYDCIHLLISPAEHQAETATANAAAGIHEAVEERRSSAVGNGLARSDDVSREKAMDYAFRNA
jgi:hypothetical protein